MKKTKIVCTIGPASESEDMIRKLATAGMNVCRLNFSHGEHGEHLDRIKTIKKVREELSLNIGIMLDLKGPEIRIGKFKNSPINLKPGDRFTLTTRDIIGDESIVSVSYKGLPDDVKVGSRILIDDGLVEFIVEEIKDSTEIITRVVNYGELKDRKGVNVPNVSIKLPSLIEKDIEDIKFGVANGVDFIAASFVRSAEDVINIKRVLEENGGGDIKIISKIENEEGLNNIEQIIDISDGIMVARGDLGVEVSNERIPIVQKNIIRKTNAAGKPVITATQMLDSMIRNPRPTRAEVNDVANAILDGSDAVMLSGETAAGKYPLESVVQMVKIAESMEASEDFKKVTEERKYWIENDSTNIIAMSVRQIAERLNANGIVAATSFGGTARAISKFRPLTTIIAATFSEKTARSLSLVWGVYPVITKHVELTDELIDSSIYASLKGGLVYEGDLIVLTAGIPAGIGGNTNLIKVHTVGKVLLQGQAIGKGSVVGRICIASSAKELYEKFVDGDILVADQTNPDMVKYIERSSGMIIKEGGLTSHAAIYALHFKKPSILGADYKEAGLKDGQTVTLDAISGIVYDGVAKVI